MAISSIRSALRARKPPETPEAAPKAVTSAYVDPTQVYGDKGQNFDAKVLSGTKFGDLVLDGSEFVSGGKELTISGEEALARGYENLPYKATNLNLTINGQTYTFHPKNILEKGFVADGKQFYNPSVLANLDKAYEQGQAVNLKDVGWYDEFLKKNDLSTEGILLPAGELNFKVAGGNGYKVAPIGNLTADGRVKLNEITGIGKVGDQYVYTTDVTKVDATDASGYYDQSGQGQAQWTKEKGGLVGSASRAIAKVPFLPEIAGAVTAPTGYGPYVYATLKGLQGGATGRDPLKVGLQAGATILAADLASGLLKGTPAGTEIGTGAYDAGIGLDVMNPPAVPPSDYGLLGGTGAYDAGIGLEAMTPQPSIPPMTAEQLAASNIDPVLRESMSAQDITREAINSPYFKAAQSNIDPAFLEGMSAAEVAGAPVLTSAGLASGAAASTIGLSDAVRGLRTASSINSLINPPSAGGGGGGVDQGGGQPTMTGVDYSGLYNLLAQRASGGGLLGTRYQPQPLNLASLLG